MSTGGPSSKKRTDSHRRWTDKRVRSSQRLLRKNLAIDGQLDNVRFLIRDRDVKYTAAFNEVFRTEDIEILHTPIRAPRANAFAERWVRTVRAECLDWIMVLGRRSLEGILGAYVSHYNRARPHRGLDLSTPERCLGDENGDTHVTRLIRRSLLGGLIHEYEAAA